MLQSPRYGRLVLDVCAWLSLFIIAFAALSVFALDTPDPVPPAPPPSTVATSGAQAAAIAAASSTAAAQALAEGGRASSTGGAGGVGGAGGSSSASGAGDSGASSSTSTAITHRTSVLTMSTAEAVRIAPECWRPADRFGRPISTPLFALGGRVVRDDDCWQEFVKGREHERHMEELRVEIERDNAHAARDDAARERVEAEQERERWVRK